MQYDFKFNWKKREAQTKSLKYKCIKYWVVFTLDDGIIVILLLFLYCAHFNYWIQLNELFDNKDYFILFFILYWGIVN